MKPLGVILLVAIIILLAKASAASANTLGPSDEMLRT
jgi:hypothetical protein